ncbi:hypothetical protein [Nevskia sp.]|uniref:hypothetical protein n=1 Tax=Nevskia sp. TaxID=1929292 RepID=UPI0025F4F297|nr:hypothetical protein [Nevskia sp.]
MQEQGRKLATAAILGFAVAASSAQAGAWTQKDGGAYQKLSFNYFSSDEAFGAPAPGFEQFDDRNLTYYGEFGLRDDLTLFTSVAGKSLESRSGGETFKTTGIGDLDLGLRYNLVSSSYQLSTALLFKAPYFYGENDEVPLGNAQEDVESRLLFGKGFGPWGYIGIELGYRFRLGAPADEFRYLLEYGFKVLGSGYLRAKLDGIQGIGNGRSVGDASSGNPLLNLEFNIGKLETTVGWWITPKFAAEFTATNNLYGENTLKGVNYMFAVVYAY